MDPNDKRLQNLVPNSERTPTEREELARKAGIASGVARREKKSIIDKARMLGEMTIRKGRGVGIEDIESITDIQGKNVYGDDAVILATWNQARSPGNVPAKELWFRLRGVKIDEPMVEVVNPQPFVFSLPTVPDAAVAKAKAEHEARQLESDKKE